MAKYKANPYFSFFMLGSAPAARSSLVSSTLPWRAAVYNAKLNDVL